MNLINCINDQTQRLLLILLLVPLLISFVEAQKDIIVIGIGVSGIKAASTLMREGYNVTVLEARDRLGGRVWSDTQIFGYYIELGAAWIHNHKENPAYPLAIKSGIKIKEFNYDSVNDLSSSLDHLRDAEDLLEEAGKKFQQFLKQKRKIMEENNDPDESLQVTYNDYLAKNKFTFEEKLYLDNYIFYEIQDEYAARLKDMSLYEFDAMKSLDKSSDYIVLGGYVNVFKSLTNRLKVIFNSVVTEINQNLITNKVVVSLKNNTFTADYVLVTVPLGCLKRNTIKFIPDLSEEKQNAIKTMGVGTMEKIIVEFSEAFWDNKYTLLKILNQPVTILGWAVNYKKVDGKNILLFLAGGGNQHYQPLYNASREELNHLVISTLSPLFPGKNIKIEKIYVTNWKHDEFAYGSYSGYAPNSCPAMVGELAKPEGRVYFAGEHTNKNYIQTVQGAYFSGFAAARKIMNNY